MINFYLRLIGDLPEGLEERLGCVREHPRNPKVFSSLLLSLNGEEATMEEALIPLTKRLEELQWTLTSLHLFSKLEIDLYISAVGDEYWSGLSLPKELINICGQLLMSIEVSY